MINSRPNFICLLGGTPTVGMRLAFAFILNCLLGGTLENHYKFSISISSLVVNRPLYQIITALHKSLK